jgi:hypothetical protein
MEQSLCLNFLSKIEHQFDRISHLISLIPEDKLEWTPPIPKAFSIKALLSHFMDCFAGICAVLHKSYPERLEHFLDLKKFVGTQKIDIAEAQSHLTIFRDHVREGFRVLLDADLGRKLPTVFVSEGESILSLLLINFEHLASHKYQLFIYLRILGLNVSSKDLYHFSGE